MTKLQWSERMIARALCTQFLHRKCILLVPNTTWAGSEADVLGVTMDLRLIDIEIKISRGDLKADAEKGKWWEHHWPQWNNEQSRYDEKQPAERREWPSKVWKHYYAVPAEIWNDGLFPVLASSRSGVLLLSKGRSYDAHGGTMIDICSARRAQPSKDAKKLTPEQVVDIARLANLRMWEAYADVHRKAADVEKVHAMYRAAGAVPA